MRPSDTLLDRGQLLNRCLDNVEFTLQMLDVFQESAPRVGAQLKVAVQNASMEEARRHAHTLKGSAANMSIERLRVLAAEIEQMADQQLQAKIEAKLPVMEDVLQQSLAATKQFADELRENK